MKENEVRVGNWVLNPMTREEFQIRPMDANICFHWPINLTEEWLLKFGFIRPEANAMWYERDYLRLKILLCFQEEGETDFLLQVQAADTGDTVEFMNTECMYVHQLQNAYKTFTGTELEIK